MSRSVIVIGGAGFLGKKILRILLRTGYQNIACGDIINPNIENIEFYPLNVLELGCQHTINKFEIVINCTGQITNPIESCILQNSLGIKNIIDSLQENSHLIHLSTVGVYGTISVAGEDCPLNPETAYSTAKAAAEVLIQNKCLPKKYSILRLSNLYGPDQPKGVISYLYRSSITDKKLFFEHDGSLERFFLHTNDCVDTIAGLISKTDIPSGIYNLSSNEKFTIRELISRIESMKKFSYEVKWGNQKSWENIEKIPTEKIQKITKFEPLFSLVDYIDSTFKS